MSRKKKSKKSRRRSGSSRSGSSKKQRKQDDGPVTVTLTAMAHGGSALGRAGGRTVFVPYTIPGEKVRARIVQRRGGVDFAQGVELLTVSADRVEPGCQHFGPGRCRNCQWQHINARARVLIKQDVLADQLARVGKFSDKLIDSVMQPVIPSPDQWGYQYQMTMIRGDDGQFGYYREDGKSIMAIEECPVLHPALQALYQTLDIDFEGVEKIQMQAGSDGETMLILEMAQEDAPQLAADFATSVNLILPDNEPLNLVGDSATHYDVGGRAFRVTAGAFFRANVPQVDNLIGELLQMAALSGDEKVLDLYAGVGVYSAFLAHRADLVTLVESYPPAVTDADANLQDFENVDVIEGSVEAVLESLLEADEAYDLAVVDPPSAGLSREALDHLTVMAVPSVIYISDDPATLARDGQQLARAGYRLRRVQPLDFDPQTYYITALAHFERTQ